MVIVDDVEALGYPGDVRSRTSSFWPDETKGPWIVTITWVRKERDVVPAGIDVRSFDLGAPIAPTFEAGPAGIIRLNSTDLGKLPIARLIRLHQRHVLAGALIMADDAARPAKARSRHNETADLARSAKTHRRDYGPDHWQLVADLYRTASSMETHTIPGDERPGYKPARWVADQLRARGFRHLDDSTVHDWIRRARQYGYLPPATRRPSKETDR